MTKAPTVARAIVPPRSHRRDTSEASTGVRQLPSLDRGLSPRRFFQCALDPGRRSLERGRLAGLHDDLDLAALGLEARVRANEHRGMLRLHLLQNGDDAALRRPVP